ncbi:MAG TPA: 16S rRNA (cytidine(1402)-2'-O)-methyltransferase [Actinomycetota bacterium]
MSGLLSVVGTPIGNLDDLSPRAARAIQAADVIACEDTRVARVLLQRVAAVTGERSRARLVTYHARNERARVRELLARIGAGERVALTTDAGMPGLSDPGHRLIAACREAGYRVEVIPGASAVTTALVASGFPSARFVFEGFLPRTGASRRRRLDALAAEQRTIVLFESPHRVVVTLRDLAAAFGADRPAAIARELTKMHEEVVRGSLAELAETLEAAGARGEITIVVAGAEPEEAAVAEPADLARDVADRMAAGTTKREAIAAVAAERAVPKRAVYQAVVDRG